MKKKNEMALQVHRFWIMAIIRTETLTMKNIVKHWDINKDQ